MFQASEEELSCLGVGHLAIGLFATWLVGMGRHWDDPQAVVPQALGLNSIAYVLVLAGLLWLVIWPLGARNWNYVGVLTYVSLTAPPAALYALPVERWFALPVANSINVWFLAVVSFWRVSLLVVYLRRLAKLRWGAVTVATLLPLCAIIAALFALNLDHAVLDLMAGIRYTTPHDEAYVLLLLLSVLSAVAFAPVLLCYAVFVTRAITDGQVSRLVFIPRMPEA